MGNAQVNYNKKKKTNVCLQFMIDYYDKISFLKVKHYLRERERERERERIIIIIIIILFWHI